jgi:hypothetical protein
MGLNWKVASLALIIFSAFVILTVLQEPLNSLWVIWTSGPQSVVINRWGVLLQLLAGISALPDLIGDDSLRKADETLKDFSTRIKQMNIFKIREPETVLTIPGTGCLLFVSSIVWFIATTIMSLYVIQCESCTGFARVMMPIMFSGPIAILLVLSLIVLLFRIIGKAPPFLIGVMFAVLTALNVMYPLLMTATLATLLGFVLQLKSIFPLRSIILVVSFPLFILGTTLQLISTIL